MDKSIVNQASVDLYFATQRDCQSQIDGLHHFVTHRLANILDRELSQFASLSENTIEIDSINLDLGEADFGDYCQVFESRLTTQLRNSSNSYAEPVKGSAVHGALDGNLHAERIRKTVQLEDDSLFKRDSKRSADAVGKFVEYIEQGSFRSGERYKTPYDTLQSISGVSVNSLRKRISRGVTQITAKALVENLSTDEINLLVLKLCPELQFITSHGDGMAVQGTSLNKSAVVSLLLSQIQDNIDERRTTEVDLSEQTVLPMLSTNSKGELTRAYEIFERLFASDPTEYFESGREIAFRQLGEVKNIHSGIRNLYRQALNKIDTRRLVGRLLQRATVQELEKTFALCVSGNSSLLISSLNSLADQTGRPDLIWSIAVVSILRSGRIDLNAIRKRCKSLQSEFPDNTTDRFSWFLNEDFSQKSSVQTNRVIEGKTKDDLKSQLNEVFICHTNRPKEEIQNRLAATLSKADSAKMFAALLPVEYQIAVLRYLKGDSDWRSVNGVEHRFDTESRLQATRNTAYSWNHSLTHQELAMANQGPGLSPATDDTLAGGSCYTAVTKLAAKSEHNGRAAGDGVIDNNLATQIYNLPESTLADIAVRRFGEAFYLRHSDIECVSDILECVTERMVEHSNAANDAFGFTLGKTIKWAYMLGMGRQAYASSQLITNNETAAGDSAWMRINSQDQSRQTSRKFPDEALRLLAKGALLQFARECTAQQDTPNRESEVRPCSIEQGNRIHWNHGVVRDAVKTYIDKGMSVDDKQIDRYIKVAELIHESIKEPLFLETGVHPPTASIAVNEYVEIENAGIVLLVNLLPRLFAMNGLLDEEDLNNDQARTVAQHLINYCSYADNPPNDQQPLTNLICAVDALDSLDSNYELTTEQKQNADEMLRAVLQSWDIGNTSVDGLRSAFLSRPGQLHKAENGWKLKVEPSSFDVLLDRLPWSFSVVKLRWMEEPVHVSWR